MTIETDVLIVWGIAVAGLIFCVESWRRDARVILQMRRHSSRFPLFAARDELVDLVASGKMAETDEAWSAAYEAVNTLLNLEQKLDLKDFLEGLLTSLQEEKSNHELQRRRELLAIELRGAAEAVPEFGSVLEGMNRALLSLVADRTTGSWGMTSALYFLRIVIPGRRLLAQLSTFFGGNSGGSTLLGSGGGSLERAAC